MKSENLMKEDDDIKKSYIGEKLSHRRVNESENLIGEKNPKMMMSQLRLTT